MVTTRKQILTELSLTPKQYKERELELFKSSHALRRAFIIRLVGMGVIWLGTRFLTGAILGPDQVLLRLALTIGAIFGSFELISLLHTNAVVLREMRAGNR